MKNYLRILIAATIAVFLVACSAPPADVQRVVAAQGVTQIVLGGANPWACGKDDTFSTTFTGVGVNGQPVSGVVCSAMFKGYTVRFF